MGWYIMGFHGIEVFVEEMIGLSCTELCGWRGLFHKSSRLGIIS